MRLATSLGELKKEIVDLKILLLDDPEAVIVIPLIKKDIENLKSNLDETRSLSKWFLGIMVSMLFGLIGIIIRTTKVTK